jgi:hypothetical protein
VQIFAAGFLFYASLPVIPARHGQGPKPAASISTRSRPGAGANGQLGTSLPVITSMCVPTGFWSFGPVP